MKDMGGRRWFSEIRVLLDMYNLPTAYTLLASPPCKDNWKALVNAATTEHVEKDWKEEAETKSSPRYLNAERLRCNTPHHVYRTVRSNRQDIQRAELKARLLIDTYTLQGNRSAFNQYRVDPTCRLCLAGSEDRQHFIAEYIYVQT